MRTLLMSSWEKAFWDYKKQVKVIQIFTHFGIVKKKK